jgi:hypothetical protein
MFPCQGKGHGCESRHPLQLQIIIARSSNGRTAAFEAVNDGSIPSLAARIMVRKKNWSGYVIKHSFALDLEEGVFTWDDPKKIAASLKISAENSLRRKASPFQSAMSMLNFYINRAGKKLPTKQKQILNQAKVELRKLFKR